MNLLSLKRACHFIRLTATAVLLVASGQGLAAELREEQLANI